MVKQLTKFFNYWARESDKWNSTGVDPEDIFDIEETLDGNKDLIFKVKFKHNRQMLHNGMSTKRDTALRKAHQWISENKEEAFNLIFEKAVLLDSELPKQ